MMQFGRENIKKRGHQSTKNPGICIYGVNYAPEPTGIGPYTTELAETLVSTGTPVRVITAVPHYPHWRVEPSYRRHLVFKEQRAGVNVIRLWARMPRPMNGFQRALFELSYLVGALLHPPDHSEQTVVGVIPGLGSGFAAALHGRIRGRRVVMIVQDLAAQGLSQSGMASHRLLAWVAKLAERFALRNADSIIAITDTFVPTLVANGARPDAITVLPNWSRTQPVSSKEPASPPVLLHAGSMGAKQGLEQLIDAARLAAKANHDWQFVLVGDGSERPRLEVAAAGLSNVEFRDPVPEAELPDLLASASVLLLSQAPCNIDMSFPSKLTSYFTAGRPVVAAVPLDGSVAKLLVDEDLGVVTPAGDAIGIISAAGSVLEPDVRRRLVTNAAAYAERQWQRDAQLRSWMAALQPGLTLSPSPAAVIEVVPATTSHSQHKAP